MLNRISSRQIHGLEQCHRHYLLANSEQETFPILFENYCISMNHMRFPQVAFIDIARNAAIGHLFLFIGEDERTVFLNKNPQIKMLCQ